MEDEAIFEAPIAKVTTGSRLQCDAGFTCLLPRQVLMVQRNRLGLYIPCREGHHYLDGQIGGRDDARYVGLRLLNG